MWKLNKSSKVLLDDSPEEEETRPRGPPPAAAFAAPQNKDQFLHDEVSSSVSHLATKVQGASFRGWKEVTSMFNKDDEQQLLAGCKSPKSKGTNLKLKEEMKSEKKPGFWDSLVIKQNVPSRKPDEIEGWEPPQITTADSTSDAATPLSDYTAWSGWEDETKGSTKYTNLASSGNSSRWSIKSAGKLFSGLEFLHSCFLEIPAEMCLEGNCSKMVLVGWGFFPNIDKMLKDIVLKFTKKNSDVLCYKTESHNWRIYL
uniref:Testis development related protein n=1 Tax=Ficedula albicollis TaxID=59894 RepID=A0A803VAS1_FICAL